jgi:glycerophosphoryl diester phosphodiesterase
LSKTLNLAHRGANTLAPENTLPAFRKAIEVGASGLEFDVQLSKDGAVVVIHDEKLERTTSGSGLVKDYTLEELHRLDAGKWYSDQFVREQIPTLEQVLDEFAGQDLIFNIELKSGIILYPGLEEKVIRQITSRKLEDKVIVSSFNHYSLVTCRELNKDVRTGILYVAGLFEPWNYAQIIDCYSVHPLFYHLQHPELVNGFREHNLAIYAWTVNEIPYMEMLVAGGIEAIITDFPQDLKKVIDGGN